MLRPPPGQNVFLGGVLLAALLGMAFFGWLAGWLLCCIVAFSADRLAAWSTASFKREGYLASMFAGASIAWLTLLIGMGAMAALGALVALRMRTADWLWANGLFGPFLSPVGAFLGASFATLPSLLMGAELGVTARRKAGLS